MSFSLRAVDLVAKRGASAESADGQHYQYRHLEAAARPSFSQVGHSRSWPIRECVRYCDWIPRHGTLAGRWNIPRSFGFPLRYVRYLACRPIRSRPGLIRFGAIRRPGFSRRDCRGRLPRRRQYPVRAFRKFESMRRDRERIGNVKSITAAIFPAPTHSRCNSTRRFREAGLSERARPAPRIWACACCRIRTLSCRSSRRNRDPDGNGPFGR